MPSLLSTARTHARATSIRSRRLPAAVSPESISDSPQDPFPLPEQKLWMHVLDRALRDIEKQGEEALRMTARDRANLEFVAMAIGLGGDALGWLAGAGVRMHQKKEAVPCQQQQK